MSQTVPVTSAAISAQTTPAAANGSIPGVTAMEGGVGAAFVQVVLALLNMAEPPKIAAEKSAHDGKTLPPTLPAAAQTDGASNPVTALLALMPGAPAAQPAPAQEANQAPENPDDPAVGDAAMRTLANRLTLNLSERTAPKDPDTAAEMHDAKNVVPADLITKALAAGVTEKPVVRIAPDSAAPVPATTLAGATHVSTPDAANATAGVGQAAAAAPATGGAQSAAQAPTNSPVPLQQHGFDDALGDRVVWLTNAKIHSAEIQVTPPELGPIEVRIQVRNDQASISFGASQPVTREAIESAIPRLREMLGQQGLNLADVNVSQHSFADRREGGAFSDGGAGSNSDLSVASVTSVPARVVLGMVDLYA